MLYKYDKEHLNYKKVTGTWLIAILCVLLMSIAVTTIVTINRVNNVRFISEETKAIILREADKQNEFSREKLKAYIAFPENLRAIFICLNFISTI